MIVLLVNSSYNLHVARSTTSFVDSRYRVTCTGQDTESCAPEEPCRFRVLISCRIHSQIGRRTDVIPHASHNHTSWSDEAESCDSSRRNNIVDRQHFLVRDKILNTDLTTTNIIISSRIISNYRNNCTQRGSTYFRHRKFQDWLMHTRHRTSTTAMQITSPSNNNRINTGSVKPA